MAVRSAGAGGVQILKRIDAEGMIDQRANASVRCLRSLKRSDAGNLIAHCGAADGFFVIKGLAAEGRIDDEIDAAGFHQIDDIWPAFVGLIDGLCGYSCRGERRGRAPSGEQSEAKLRATPMTSPVERISGPRMVSTPRNLLKGNTGDFTA